MNDKLAALLLIMAGMRLIESAVTGRKPDDIDEVTFRRLTRWAR